MVRNTLRRAFDGAHLVMFARDRSECVVWYGGTQFAVYLIDVDETAHEIDVFNVSDDEGRPVDRETAEKHARDWLDRRAYE